MDDIIGTKNVITTDCGHTFHCKCLMQNTKHNGFSCPYCRTIMVEKDEDDEENEDEDDEDYEEEYYNEDYDDYTLTSFRMFHQSISGEEIEEETENEENTIKPNVEYITNVLQKQGITYEYLIQCLLIEQEDYQEDYYIEKEYNKLYGRIKHIITQYRENENNMNVV